MIVVDTNVLAYLFLPGESTARAEAWLRKDRGWVAPTLWRSEFRNVLAGCLRRGQITFESMCDVDRAARSLMRGAEHEVDSERVLELVRDSDCSAYDCEFIAVALRLGVTLLTADRKLLKSFPSATTAFASL